MSLRIPSSCEELLFKCPWFLKIIFHSRLSYKHSPFILTFSWKWLQILMPPVSNHWEKNGRKKKEWAPNQCTRHRMRGSHSFHQSTSQGLTVLVRKSPLSTCVDPRRFTLTTCGLHVFHGAGTGKEPRGQSTALKVKSRSMLSKHFTNDIQGFEALVSLKLTNRNITTESDLCYFNI